jgi:class 3 adenylate cyclase
VTVKPSPGSAAQPQRPSTLIQPEVADASELPEGERKTVTALFADIKGSTELIRDLDPEEARALVDPVLRLMIEAVHRYDGYVAQSTGDGIFALLGAPLAHEDHPRVRETRRKSLTAGDRRRSPPHRTAPGDVQKRSYSRPSPEGLLERRERLDLTDLFGIGATCKMYGTLYRLAPMENSFGCDTVRAGIAS